jgi:DNA-binding Lrp family transcriptional regulator
VKTSVATAKNISEKTVQRRIAELVERRLLEVDGAAVARRIKSTKLA